MRDCKSEIKAMLGGTPGSAPPDTRPALGTEAAPSGENGPTSRACGTTPAAWVLQPKSESARRSQKARDKGSSPNGETKTKIFDRDSPCLDIRGHLRVRRAWLPPPAPPPLVPGQLPRPPRHVRWRTRARNQRS